MTITQYEKRDGYVLVITKNDNSIFPKREKISYEEYRQRQSRSEKSIQKSVDTVKCTESHTDNQEKPKNSINNSSKNVSSANIEKPTLKTVSNVEKTSPKSNVDYQINNVCNTKLSSISSPFTPEESRLLEINIDTLINAHKANRQEINRLVFESVTAMTVGDDYERELESKKGIKRFLGSITGSNKKLQDKINSSRAAAQYASQQTLQRLAEQNLMSFDLITAVNNKLNASVVAIEGEINQIYRDLVTFFKQSRSDMIQLENRVDRLERNVSLLNWQNSIEYQMFNGIDYAELDDTAKIVCLARDFYDITNAEWTTSDLLLLKTAMATIDLSPKEKICYQIFVKEILSNTALLAKLFEGVDLTGIENYPEYIALSAGIQKGNLLVTSEKYLIDSAVSLMQTHGCLISDEEVKEEMITLYEADKGQFDITRDVNTFDFILEILYNLQQIREIKKVEVLEAKIKKMEEIYSVYCLDKRLQEQITFRELIESDMLYLQESSDYGYVKAKFLLYQVYWYEGNDELCEQFLQECIDMKYLPAEVSIFLEQTDNDLHQKENFDLITEYKNSLKILADAGDKIAETTMKLLCEKYDVNLIEPNRAKKDMFSNEFNQAKDELFKYNLSKAFDLLNNLSARGCGRAKYLLGEIFYKKGYNNINQNAQMYTKLFYEGMQLNDELCAINYAYTLNNDEKEKIIKDSIMKIQKSAKSGDIFAQYEYAELILSNRVIDSTIDKGLNLLKEVASKGYWVACIRCGSIYANGYYGCSVDYAESSKWYMISANLGDVYSMEYIARSYEGDRDKKQNLDKEAEWYIKAAKAGSIEAYRNAGVVLFVSGHHEEGVWWLREAVRLGDKDAIQDIKNVFGASYDSSCLDHSCVYQIPSFY